MDLAAPKSFAPCHRVVGCLGDFTYVVHRDGRWSVHPRRGPGQLADGRESSLVLAWDAARRTAASLARGVSAKQEALDEA